MKIRVERYHVTHPYKNNEYFFYKCRELKQDQRYFQPDIGLYLSFEQECDGYQIRAHDFAPITIEADETFLIDLRATLDTDYCTKPISTKEELLEVINQISKQKMIVKDKDTDAMHIDSSSLKRPLEQTEEIIKRPRI